MPLGTAVLQLPSISYANRTVRSAFVQLFRNWGNYEHSEQARAPHTNGPRDVPRCGALSSSSKDAKRLDFILWGSEFTSKAAKRLDLIQTQVAQRRMQRVEVYARALRLSQHVK